VEGQRDAAQSYDKWDNLIKPYATLDERYGANEVKQWYFEIWNKADYPVLGTARSSKRARRVFRALRPHGAGGQERESGLSVGGPAGSQTIWIQPLIEFCKTNQLPLDFISFHTLYLSICPAWQTFKRKQAGVLRPVATGRRTVPVTAPPTAKRRGLLSFAVPRLPISMLKTCRLNLAAGRQPPQFSDINLKADYEPLIRADCRQLRSIKAPSGAAAL